jgi:hypothetical protein
MAYGNRTDLNNPMTKMVAPGQTYGKGAAQRRAQQAVPMASAASDMPAQAPAGPVPGGLGDFTRPTERPQEPITAGVNFGPGMNADQAGVNRPMRSDDPLLDRIQQLYAMFPNEDVADLLDSYVKDGY